MRLVFVAAAACALMGCGEEAEPADTPDADAQVFEEAVTNLEAEMKSRKIPGLSMAVVLDGKLTFTAALGVRSRETNEPVTPETRFRVSSMTKMLVAATVLDLAEEGLVDLDEPVQTYAPFVDFDSADKVTLRHLLTHTAGIVADSQTKPQAIGKGSLQSWFEANPDLSLAVSPGTLFNYSNLGFGAAAAVIEAKTGLYYTDAIRDRTMLPLGMTQATFDPAAAMQGDHAVGHGETNGKPTILPMEEPNFSMWNSAGGVIATASDYAHLVESFIAGTGPIGSEAMADMSSTHTSTGWGDGYAYGYGLMIVESFGGERLLAHGGWTGEGWSSSVAWLPGKRAGVVLLTNAGEEEHVHYVMEEAIRVLGRFAGISDMPNFAKPPSERKKYVGTYAGPGLYTFEVSVDGQGELWAKMETWNAPEKMTPGDPPIGLSSGDSYTFGDFVGTFWPGKSGQSEFMVVRSRQGTMNFVAVRQP